ncbi:serine/threonine-protein kinase [Piscinibacter sp. XHJ-5]|uniref:serine/threonine-protein kinase n=1 Tax=Piscinibacter sp. XHJ-5 TaxID=3037797 RepID=UPI002452C013|nr:serine/threonine-protein kinase [Piscinibacter sp. XHJ-5]
MPQQSPQAGTAAVPGIGDAGDPALTLGGGQARRFVVGKTEWARLSPLLDELLDLPTSEREHRQEALRREDPQSAQALAMLLGQLDAVERSDFLSRPPSLPETAGLAGETVGAYTIVRELGQGGMGSVWLARRTDGRYEGSVAIKFLNLGLRSRGLAERFSREGSILARLAHPNIARLIDAGVEPRGRPYLVLEYIDGEPIDRYCEARSLDVAARVRVFLDVLAAVAHAHNRLILHRDIKPSNILVTPAGEVKLLDFGIAKLMDDASVPTSATELTRLDGNAFTPQFAAPEQVQGGDVTTATDVYALGVLLYVLLGGSHPTPSPSGTPVDQMRAVVEIEPRRLSDAVGRRLHGDPAGRRFARQLRGDLDNIVAKALKKSPAERYANAAAFADDLRRYLADEPVAARRDALSYRTAKFVRRHRAGVAAACVVVATIAGGIGVALWQAGEARRQQIQAEGLIEFMLGDLRRKLQPVGRLDVLDAVGEKALAYYATQGSGRLDADSLGRRSRALHLIGEIHEKRGRLDDAQAAFEAAVRTTGQLLERAPNDGQRIFDHAQSVYWVGYIARRRGQLKQAEDSFGRYLDLAQRLSRLDPRNLDWRLETFYAGQNVGIVYLDTGQAEQALRSFVDAQRAMESIVQARPEHRLELANSHGWIARAHDARGDFAAAIAAEQAKVDVLRAVPDARLNREVQRLLGNAAFELGRLHLSLGDAPLALREARSAVEQLDALVALDSTNLLWLDQGCFARLSLAGIELALRHRDAAQAELDRVASDIGRIVAAGPPYTRRQMLLLAWLYELRAGVALAGGAALPTAPVTSYLAAIAAQQASGTPLDAVQARQLSALNLLLGDWMSREGRPEAAEAQWRAVAERLRPVAAKASAPALTLLARAELRLGASDAAAALATRIQASPYRHPDLAALVNELADGPGPRRHINPRKKP